MAGNTLVPQHTHPLPFPTGATQHTYMYIESKDRDHSNMSCLGSSVGKSVAWKVDGRGFKSHPRQPIFL